MSVAIDDLKQLINLNLIQAVEMNIKGKIKKYRLPSVSENSTSLKVSGQRIILLIFLTTSLIVSMIFMVTVLYHQQISKRTKL